ncbi:MAG: hypothetical protein ACNA7J_03060 [Wenzhouxiangella sp.]
MSPHRISTGPCFCFLIIVAGTLVLHAPDVRAQTERGQGYDLQLELGLEHRDNPLRSEPRGASDTFLVPRATFNLFRLGALWEARGDGFVEYRQSLENTISDEFWANLAAVVDREITPGLEWTFQNVARVEQVDLLAPETEENRQQTNVFITGPNWRIRPRGAWGGALSARYLNSYAEETDEFKSNRFGATGALVRRFDANRQASLGAEFMEVRFTDDDAFDYRRHDLIGRYDSTQARLELNLAAGYTSIDPDEGSTLTEPLGRVRAIWSVDDRRSIQALAVHELTDSVRHLADEIDQIEVPFLGGPRLPVGPQIYRLSSIEVGWNQRHDRLRWSVTPFYHDFDFPRTVGADFEELGVNFAATLNLARRMSVRTALRVERREFSVNNQRDTDIRASAFLNRRFNPRWSGRIGVVRLERDSNVDGADSRDNMVMLYLTFHAGA